MSSERHVYEHFEVQLDAQGHPIRLGRGGMGTTIKAMDTRRRKLVALKVINPEVLSSPGSRERFFNEARALDRVDHPNVARLHHLCQDDAEECFFAMELVDGVSLADLITRDGPLSPKEGLQILRGMADALTALAAHHLIHRDIKPDNIMLTRASGRREWWAKLIDFGLVKPLMHDAAIYHHVETVGTGLGTPQYASPEQILSGEREVDHRTDYYSLGATLWYALAGVPPFRGALYEVQDSHVRREPPWEELAELPPPVLALLRSLLAKSPSDRPSDAEAVLAEWDAALAALADFGEAASRSLPQPRIKGRNDLTPVQLEERETPSGAWALPAAPGRLERDASGTSWCLLRVIPGTLSATLKEELLHTARTCQGETPQGILPVKEVFGREVVSEWVRGVSGTQLLAQQRGALPLTVVQSWLPNVADTLDWARTQRLSRIGVEPARWLISFDELPQTESALLRASLAPRDWGKTRVLLDPLAGFDPDLMELGTELNATLLERPTALLSDRSQYLGAMARSIYELLGGRAYSKPSPLPILDEEQNLMLLMAMRGEGNAESAAAWVDSFAKSREDRRRMPEIPPAPRLVRPAQAAAGEPMGAPTPPPTSEPPNAERRARNKRHLVLLATIGVTLVAAGAFWLLPKFRSTTAHADSLAVPPPVKPTFEDLFPFPKSWEFDGNSIKAASWGLVSSNGQIIAEPVWDKPDWLSPAGAETGVIPVRAGGKWGLLDRSGKVIVKPAWDLCTTPPDPVKPDSIPSDPQLAPAATSFPAMISQDGAKGLINERGDIVLAPAWDDLRYDAKARVVFVQKGGKWGAMDAAGHSLLAPEWDQIPSLKEGIFRVFRQGKASFLDRTGRVVGQSQWSEARDFLDGVAVVKRNTRYALLSTDGDVVGSWWDEIGPFVQHRARVKSTGKWGFIDSEGNTVGEVVWDEAQDFKDGLANVRRGRYWGCVDPNGALAIAVNLNAPVVWSESFYSMKTSKASSGSYLDQTGAIVFAGKREEQTEFHGGLAGVKIGGKWGFIDKKGKTVAAPTWEKIVPAAYWQWMVMNGQKWGVIDQAATVVVPLNFDAIEPLGDTAWRVQAGELFGAFDRTGQPIVAAKWKNVRLESDLALVVDPHTSKQGVFHYDGRPLLDAQWDSVGVLRRPHGNYVQAARWLATGAEALWTDSEGKEIWKDTTTHAVPRSVEPAEPVAPEKIASLQKLGFTAHGSAAFQQRLEECLKRIDSIRAISSANKDKLYNSLQRAKAIGFIGMVNFPNDSIILPPTQAALLKATLAQPDLVNVREDPTAVFVVAAYSDFKGPDAKDPGYRRAEAVLTTMRDGAGVNNVIHSITVSGTALMAKQAPAAPPTPPTTAKKSSPAKPDRIVEIWAVLP